MTTVQATQTRSVGLVLEPLDVLFFRDGRPFEQASHARSRSLPLPQTVAGAITTALLENGGCNFSKLVGDVRKGASFSQALANQNRELEWIASVRLRGPWLALRHRGKLHLLFAAPANVYYTDTTKELFALRPSTAALPGWKGTRSGKCGLRPLWWTGEEDLTPYPGLFTWELIRRYLHGEPVDLDCLLHEYQACGLLRSPDALATIEELTARLRRRVLTGRDRRTGIGIDARSFSVKQGMIYSVEFLALLWEPQEELQAVLYAEVDLPDGEWPEKLNVLHLGGEGRHVRVIPQATRPCWDELCRKPGQGEKPLLVLTTPGIFKQGWKPECLDQLVEAAAVSGYEAVSGWDLARGGPKPSRFAVPAGSVYFLKEQPDPPPDVLSDDPLDRQQGWGCFLQGVWKDE